MTELLVTALRGWWQTLTLTRRFLLVATIPISMNFVVLSTWIAREVTSLLIHQEAIATALYADSFVEPLVQDLATGDEISPERIAQLDQLFQNRAIAARFPRIKIWNRDGTIVFSNLASLRGKTFPQTESLKAAFEGRVIAEFDDRSAAENVTEVSIADKLLELYVPIRESSTGRIIAVSETYENANSLSEDIGKVRLEVWAMVAALSALSLAMLWGIVAGGSRTITRQRQTMNSQIEDLGRLLSEVQRLRVSVDEAHKRAAESNESVVRRIGSDLHDGPAQNIALAALHLSELEQIVAASNDEVARSAMNRVEDLLDDSLHEIRRIAAGIGTPDLEGTSLENSLRLAVGNHEWRTGTRVETIFDGELPEVPLVMRACLYRFAQEGLNNAFKHAHGIGQTLKASHRGGKLTVEVADGGPGMKQDLRSDGRQRLGLSNLRDRINSLAGKLEIESPPGGGTTVRAVFEIDSGD